MRRLEDGVHEAPRVKVPEAGPGREMKTTAIVSSLTLIAVLAAAVTGAAAQGEVIVHVTSIVASFHPERDDEGGETEIQLDPRLEPFSRRLRSLFAYERYTFIGEARTVVGLGSSCPFQLPEYLSLEVAPARMESGGSEMIEMVVTLFSDRPSPPGRRTPRSPEREVVLRTRIRLKNGGTVLLGGPPIQGGVLVLALSARG